MQTGVSGPAEGLAWIDEVSNLLQILSAVYQLLKNFLCYPILPFSCLRDDGDDQDADNDNDHDDDGGGIQPQGCLKKLLDRGHFQLFK